MHTARPLLAESLAPLTNNVITMTVLFGTSNITNQKSLILNQYTQLSGIEISLVAPHTSNQQPATFRLHPMLDSRELKSGTLKKKSSHL
jgi:hypothetical protein